MLKALVDLPHLPARAFEQRRSPSLHKAFATQARRYLERRHASHTHTLTHVRVLARPRLSLT